MKPITPYLFFNGNCREAMNFYKHCFGGELVLMTYGDSPEQMPNKNINKDEIMHAFLQKDAFTLMASDAAGNSATQGNDVHLYLDCASMSEVESLFKKLSDKGEVVLPLADTFWGAHYGMLVDKFGIHWMLSYTLKKEG